MKKSIFKRWWFWVIIVVLGAVLISNQVGKDTSVSTDNSKAATGSTAAVSDKASGKSNSKSEENSPKTKIEFKNVIVNSNMGITTLYGEVNNSDSKAHSFTIKASFYDKSKKLIGTAAGAVNDLNGGTSKIFSALGTEDYSKADSYKVQIDTMVSSTENKKEPIVFSNIVMKNTAGFSTIEGEAKNTDTEGHSFTLLVGLYGANNKLLGVAAGALNDISAGDTMTFSAMGTEFPKGVKSYKAQVDTMVK